MDAEKLRAFCIGLPHVVETRQWGDNLLLWVGDKAIGGKMFALLNLEGDGRAVISYLAGPEHFAELLEIEGVAPAPYFARLHWVAVAEWRVHRDAVWQDELRAAYELTLAKLPPKTRALLALPAAERRRAIAERKKVLDEREAAKKAKVKG